MNLNQYKTPLLWMLWHPHQGFWNKELVLLVRRILPIRRVSSTVNIAIVYLDTLILYIRAIIFRISSLGFQSVFTKLEYLEDASILYLDIGTHEAGSELSFVVDQVLPKINNNVEAIGFEASQGSFVQVEKKFASRQDVKIFHKALCDVIPENGKLRLYKDVHNSLGDSIHRQSGFYEEVEAIRLSDFLQQHENFIQDRITLLRMNIEGAEYDVVRDLVENGYAKYIDGYFGMWDDLSKIDLQRDQEFRNFLSTNEIYTFPFNGRDLTWGFRKKCIAYHMYTCILLGLNRQ